MWCILEKKFEHQGNLSMERIKQSQREADCNDLFLLNKSLLFIFV